MPSQGGDRVRWSMRLPLSALAKKGFGNFGSVKTHYWVIAARIDISGPSLGYFGINNTRDGPKRVKCTRHLP